MVGTTLHEFDLRLCGYVQINVGSHFGDSAFVEHLRSWLTPNLFTYLSSYRSNAASLPPMLLNDAELDELQEAFANPRTFFREWEASTELHRLHIDCVKEIREQLGSEVGEDWARACRRFDKRLTSTKFPLGLCDGIQIVHEWIHELRRLLQAMGGTHFLPFPEGTFPTPSNPTPPPSAPAPTSAAIPAGLTEGEWEDINRMRQAIAEHREGKNTKVKSLISAAQINNQRGRKALGWLRDHGEYTGHFRPSPGQNRQRGVDPR